MWVLLLVVLSIVFLFIAIKERKNLFSFSIESSSNLHNSSLKDCPNCDNAVSKNADICPYCKQQLKFQFTKLQAIIIGLGVLIACIWIIGSTGDSKHYDQRAAYSACERYISIRLKDPASAVFDEENLRVLEPKPDFKTIYVTVRATNSFNAIVPTHYACFVRNLVGVWTVEDIQEVAE